MKWHFILFQIIQWFSLNLHLLVLKEIFKSGHMFGTPCI